MTTLSRRATLGLLGAAMAAPAHANFGETVFLDGRGVAIRGYDPVAYLDMEDALRGKFEHQLETEDGIWMFYSEQNLEKFKDQPARYIPQFGGFDAQGMARGFKRVSDPTLWIKLDGKIYLHYSIREQNRWALDVRGNIAEGERNWDILRDI